MYFQAVAIDYDGTLARHGVVAPRTLAALKKCKESGRKLILVTGRQVDDLRIAFPDFATFDLIVGENGAVIFKPATCEERAIAETPPRRFVELLRERGVTPLSVGKCIVATWEPHEKTVLETIRDLGLELQIIFNKGAVMVLPAGVNKAAGLEAAALDLELSLHNIVAVGDAENDFSFMRLCGCATAVANALSVIRDGADIKLSAENGEGVVELLDRLSREDAGLIPTERHGIRLGVDRGGAEVRIAPQRGGVLIAGSSGVGKSTLATALTEYMAERGFQFCVFDPEGDYVELEHAISVGNSTTAPDVEGAVKLLRQASANVVINTQCLGVGERPGFFQRLLPKLTELRARTGRPHWLIIDEAHHLLPAARQNIAQLLPKDSPSVILITVHPNAMSTVALKLVRTIVAVGDAAEEAIRQFCDATNIEKPGEIATPGEDEVVFWETDSKALPRAVKVDKPAQAHKRHIRKYAEGDLGAERSFYFKGPDGALNLKAQNLLLFMQIAEGVDDETWEFHRRNAHYSAWFRDAVKDPDLAAEVEATESDAHLDPAASRRKIAAAINRRYTASA